MPVLCLAMSLAGCGPAGPYRFTAVSGEVVYDDGSLLPVEQLVLNFHPQGENHGGAHRPPVGTLLVDRKTGHFRSGKTRQTGGIVIGRHAVTLHLPGRNPLPGTVAGDEYSDPLRTPLVVDTEQRPFRLVVRKPPG